MMKKILILLSFCLLPIFTLSSSTIKINNSISTTSTVASIIGPIVGMDDMLGDGSIPSSSNKPNDWSSSTGVKKDTAYTDGGLRPYDYLYVVNRNFDTKYGGWQYASFVQYFTIVRQDGRKIYDDDGVIDVRWWNDNGDFVESDEIVDYDAKLYVKTQIMPYSYGGFLGTVLNAKFESGAYFEITWDRGEDPEDVLYDDIHDKDANNMGSGNYRNGGVNPGPQYYYLCDMDYCGSPYVTVMLCGKGYWENGWWGGCFDYTNINSLLTGFIPRSDRDWSNWLFADGKTKNFKGEFAYYNPKPFVARASNLNNYVKINDILATSQYGTSVAPYKDGHHILIEDEGYTKVDIEYGAENVYKTFYCFVDTKLPEVTYVYHNENALDNRKVENITTDSKGAKTQTITEGIFRDEVQVNFTYTENEAPLVATCSFNNGTEFPIDSGRWLSGNGDYVVTVKDLAGNTTISKFTIDKTKPDYNISRLQNDKTYKLSKWYLTSIPYGYSNYGSYSFGTYDLALKFATENEKSNFVTNYTLTNIDDFTATNLVANGNTITLGKYWYYKSKNNASLYVYYFDENSLNEAIEFYASKYITEEVYKINALLNPNNYGNTIDDSVYSNVVKGGYLANNFIFKQQDTNESYKIYYDYQGDDKENWVEFDYNTKFSEVVTNHGLYKIKENDYVGHEITYFVYADLQAPMLDIEAVNYGQSKTITKTISTNDIPNNNELVFYYEKFKITNVVEDDNQWIFEIRCPDYTTKRYTYLDELPNFEYLGAGEFIVTVADRTNSPFKFKVYLLGQAPQVKFEAINSNSQLRITIKTGEQFNAITDLKIYRNDICLNTENGYDEYTDRTDDELIYINTNTLKYIFGRGGIYTVEITDNFGRTLTYEYKFEKDLPTGILSGVEHNGKTKEQVKFIYDNNKYFVIVNKDNVTFEAEENIDNKITTLNFYPEENAENYYSILLVDKTDTENFNSYNFTIKTIKPIINLFGVEPNGKTGGEVYATWEGEENYVATLSFNGKNQTYRNGEIIFAEGSYELSLTDEIGNTSSVNFKIDKNIDFDIIDINQNKYEIDEIEYINFDIKLIANEPLGIKVTKDNSLIDYEFGLYFTSEGYYTVKVFDEFGNNIFFTFTVDKTPPKATLYGVENFGITKNAVWISSSETGLTSWLIKNEKNTISYTLGKEILESGKYKAFVSDKAKNIVDFEFEKDNEISFDINTYLGGISNGGIRIIAYENLRIVMYKDSKSFDYQFEQILNEEGEYSFTLFDDLGNKTSFNFSIITKKKQSLKHLLEKNISVTKIEKDEANFDFEINDENQLYLVDEGKYKIDVYDGNKNQNFSFEITIDTTPPTLELIGVENGGSTKNIVVMKNVSEKPYELFVTVDGINFDYKLGDEIEKCGRFEVVLIDEAGNSTTYTFERIYSLNGSSIGILAGLLAIAILIIIFVVKSRKRYEEDDTYEEEIEEDEEIEEVSDENAENSENE